MAIAYVRSSLANGTSVSFDIGTAGTDRLVAVFIADETTTDPITAVTVDGKNCTIVDKGTNVSIPGNHQELWYIDETGLGSSNGTVTVAITGGDTGWMIGPMLFTGCAGGTPTDSGKNTTATSTTIPVTNIDCSANGLVVACFSHARSSKTMSGQTSPLTEVQEYDNSVFDTCLCHGVESSAQTNKTYTVTLTGSGFANTGIVATWDEAAAGPTYIPITRQSMVGGMQVLRGGL